ncbi:iron-sulfur cluster assembly protein [Ruegeria sp. 2205SS24-7]|uniref:iron-sulfur cluster assembly protein n=1 Tax=Ruegeria discodermiae TaxID=3064389 RepID=UPI00274241A9|nr:iron-sulfur cluster assembly protein [Ruegeria sp. 2205SS24-7]MDP5220773.1 iron-sulfur cluster assembly protein [Ruegeria sp. 2205SS24-7]
MATLKADLEIEVFERLERVTDPELDEPITDMGFVERVEVVDAKKVEVDFRLPTYWCSPNFAFLMAWGIRQQVSSLPWVHEVKVDLKDHCFMERVNEGVNGDRDFREVFTEYCNGESLEDVRLKFMAKAFDRRQETMLLAVREAGYSAQDIVDMTLAQYDALECQGEEDAKQHPRYRELLVSRELAARPDDPVFVTWKGTSLTKDDLKDHLAKLRGTRINMEFNGALCRGLLSTRYKEVKMGDDGPTLIDFIQKAALTNAQAAEQAQR